MNEQPQDQELDDLEHFDKDSLAITYFNKGGTPERILLIQQTVIIYGHLLPFGHTRADKFAELIQHNQGLNAPVHALDALVNLDYGKNGETK